MCDNINTTSSFYFFKLEITEKYFAQKRQKINVSDQINKLASTLKKNKPCLLSQTKILLFLVTLTEI